MRASAGAAATLPRTPVPTSIPTRDGAIADAQRAPATQTNSSTAVTSDFRVDQGTRACRWGSSIPLSGGERTRTNREPPGHSIFLGPSRRPFPRSFPRVAREDSRRPVGAGNSAMVVDLPRCGPILSPCVPNLVPIPGITGSTHCAVRPLQGPRDHRVAPPTRCAAPAGQPTRTHRRRPELARGDSGRARATEPSRVAGHPRHTVALAPAPHRRTLGPTTATAGSTIDLSGASPTHTAPRS